MQTSVNSPQVTKTSWGGGVYLFTFSNVNGMVLSVSNYGAAVVSCIVPDNRGNSDDIVLGYGSLKGYQEDEFYIGTVVGRYANRINGANVFIDEENYPLSDNRNGFHHHGGFEGFNKKTFTPELIEKTNARGVKLTYHSPDGEEGYPGNLQLSVTYLLDDGNNWSVEYSATTDKATILNPTQHTYFNLAGHAAGSIEDHRIEIFTDEWLAVDERFIPTGDTKSVEGLAFDLRRPVRMGDRIDAPEFAAGRGFDNTWVLPENSDLKHAARVSEPRSGRVLDVFTTEPSVHFYSGNFIEEGTKGKAEATYGFRSGFCLETQHFPDSPHHPGFPSTVLRPGEVFSSKTVFRLGAS